MKIKKNEKLRILYEKITFQRLLTWSVVCMVSVVFLVFSILVTWLSEEKIRQNVKDNMSIVVEQFDVYLGNYTDNIFRGFKSIEADQNLARLRKFAQDERHLQYTAMNYLYVNKLLNQFLYANSTCVCNVYINFNDGAVTTQAFEQNLLKIQYSYDAWKEKFPENKYYWVNADYCRDLIPDPSVGAVLFHLYESENCGQGGIILVAMKADFFEKILDTEALDKQAGLSLITDYGIMHFGAEEACRKVDENQEYLAEMAESSRAISSQLMDGYYFMYKNMNLTNWKLVYTVKESSISNAHYIMRDVMLITAIVIFATGILLSLLSKAVSSSLQELTRKVKDKDVLEHEIVIHSYAEITSLSNGLEGMRQRINLLLKQVEMEQEAKQQIEIALLQEQINPHFLYNTLYSIMQLCEMKESEKASKMLEALSTFYRIGLNKGKNIITVQEELRHVKNYLFIQHFRYSDLFDYTIDCDPEILNCRIPKMSLQPLVENAIYHGIKQKHEFGNICILGGTSDGENAWLEVHDDGPSMTEEQMEKIRKYLDAEITPREAADGSSSGHVSFGMKNVDSRIKFEFGSSYGLEISSIPEDTCVRIFFKMHEMKAEDVKKQN